MPKDRDIVRVRTLFLSDVHLGTRGCKADMLLQFLKRYDADTIYLVGDIIDGWKLKGGWFWPQAHNDVVQKLLKKVHRGARLVYVPGNHDEFARDYLGHNFGGIDVMNEAVHVAAERQALRRHAWGPFRSRGASRAVARAYRRWRLYASRSGPTD